MQYNNAIPLLMNEYLPNGMLGIALAGLLAAFMAGVAANVSAFNTVVTYDLWEPYVRSGRSDEYYIRFGRIATVTGIVDRHRHGVDRLGLRQHHGLHPAVVQLLQRAAVRHVHHRHVLEADDAVGGLLGLVAGTFGAAAAHYGNSWDMVDLGSAQAAAFWGAIAAFVADAVVSVGVSLFTQPKPIEELQGLVYGMANEEDDDVEGGRRPGTASRGCSPSARSA